jgi:predicted RNA-binding protein with PUA domain
MHTERPIAKDEADAFDDAVAALDNWPGEDKEPEVVFRGERCTIGTM